jgi:DNA-binding response OmpR family regulator
LPTGDSLWVLKEIRRLAAKLPIIVLTRKKREETKRVALENGASLFLEKPVITEVLGHWVSQMLSSRIERDSLK